MERNSYGPWSRNGGTVLFGFALIFGTPCVVTVVAMIKGWL